jgi:lipopolysaccharide/colanic/teichoic acid biosynthesis glycosyltransferase
LIGGVARIIIHSHSPLAAPLISTMVDRLSTGLQLFDFDDVYEDVFGKVCLLSLNEGWLVKNISHYHSFVMYDIFKRAMDLIIAIPLFLVSLIAYPFVSVAIYLQDRGPVFIKQQRVGEYGTIISLLKFRSMKVSDGGVWVTENDDRITPFGKFIRNTRIDELPQLMNVIRGDLSLIGPRPDIIDLGNKLKQEIPFYTVRTIIKPGLSGWAQIQQELPPQSVEETRERLAFDCYYIKHRSFILDLSIALSTVRILLSRTGK